MGLFENLQSELDKAGAAANRALDEGRLRLELFRVRRLADEAAEALGYAVHRGRRDGGSLDTETMDRLDGTLKGHVDEADRIEKELAEIRASCAGKDDAAPPEGDAARPTT